MLIGRFFGILAILLGGIFSYLGYGMMTETGSVFKFLLAAPVFLFIGIALLFFPGGNVTAKQSRNKEKHPKAWIDEAPKHHKIIWVLAGIIGSIISIKFFGI